MIAELKTQFKDALRKNAGDGSVRLQEFGIIDEISHGLFSEAIKAWKLAGQVDGEYQFRFDFKRNDDGPVPQIKVIGVAAGSSKFQFEHNFILWSLDK
jgi:hypothetical protein